MTTTLEPTIEQRKADVIEAIGHRVKELVDWSNEREAIIGVQVGAIITEYVNHYFEADFERYQTEAVEQELVCDVVNPETGRPSPIWDHASKLDGIAFDRWNDQRVIVEHKSTSENLDPYSVYWRKLVIDSQVSKYILSKRQEGDHSINTVLYDVVQKPITKPKRIVAADVPKIVESGEYCGYRISEVSLEPIRIAYEAGKGPRGGFKGKVEENLELYAFRLRSMIAATPGDYFQRKPVTRTDDEVEEYARELWQLGAELRHARKSGLTPKNTTHCSAFGRTCEFLPLCCGEKDEHDADFVRLDFVHSELESATVKEHRNGGRDLLTNSRLTMFQSCRRRHFLRYEKGLRSAKGSDSTALQWGSIFHDLLEIVWLSYSL